MKNPIMLSLLFSLSASGMASTNMVVAGETASNPKAKQYFLNLKDGDVVTSPVTVKFGLSGMGVAPAGVDKKHTGHHHILLDRPPLGKGEDGKDELDDGIISDENNIHFGKGQTETTLKLKPGKHTLQLVLGDLNHVPHNKPIFSSVITITVK